MAINRPFYVDKVTHVPADWANAVTALLFDVFGLASTPTAARAALGIGTLGSQAADQVQITGGSINNTTIGLNSPTQGRFTVLSLDSNPISPLHAVNKRYLDSRFNDLDDRYVGVGGGVMVGPLTLAGDPIGPLEAVSKRYLTNTLAVNLVDRPIQRRRWIANTAQTDFTWPEFSRPTDVFADNFVVFRDGRFLQHALDYTVLLSAIPRITLNTAASPGQVIDAMYLNNLNNLLAVPTVSPSDPFSAAPAWADPVNLRIGYAINNSGRNSISSSSTMLRDMYVSGIVLVGALGDRQISWIGTWMPATQAAANHPPTITSISATEAHVRLPENIENNEFFWEGRYEITMYVDGVPSATRLWCDMNNEQVPNLTDGVVRWGVVDDNGEVLPINLTTEVSTVCSTIATLAIDGGTRTAFQRSHADGVIALTFTNSGLQPEVVVPPQELSGVTLPNGWSEAFPTVLPGTAKTITANYHITATANQNVVFNFVDCPGPLTVALTA